MHRIHLIPGTTFSNVADKGGYDSEGRAVMTLKELERWLALEILGVYHKSVHSRTTSTSGASVERTDFRRDPTPIRHPHDPGRFLLDFLPAEERLIRRDGIRMFNLHYWDNVLSPLAGRSQQRLSSSTIRETCPAFTCAMKRATTGPFPIAISARRRSRYGSTGTPCAS